MLWPLCAAPLAHLCLPISLPGLSRCKWYPFSKARSAPSTPTPASSGLSNKPAWQCLSPPLSTVARVPDGQAWTQHRPPRRASVKPDQLVAESCTSRKGGQDRRGVSKGAAVEIFINHFTGTRKPISLLEERTYFHNPFAKTVIWVILI